MTDDEARIVIENHIQWVTRSEDPITFKIKREGLPSAGFWSLWHADKEQLHRLGYRLYKASSGKWIVAHEADKEEEIASDSSKPIVENVARIVIAQRDAANYRAVEYYRTNGLFTVRTLWAGTFSQFVPDVEVTPEGVIIVLREGQQGESHVVAFKPPSQCTHFILKNETGR